MTFKTRYKVSVSVEQPVMWMHGKPVMKSETYFSETLDNECDAEKLGEEKAEEIVKKREEQKNRFPFYELDREHPFRVWFTVEKIQECVF